MPDEVARIAGVMRDFPAPWFLSGGWAVDAWLGESTREHGDVDVSVFVRDQRALHAHLAGWQLLAHDPAWAPGDGEPWWDGSRTLGATTHIHARPPERAGEVPKDGIANDEDGFSQEFYLDDRDGEDWILQREPFVSLPVADGVRACPWGISAAAPHVLLFFKSRDLRRRDRADFARLLPKLDTAQRAWLRDAIARCGHPWLAAIDKR